MPEPQTTPDEGSAAARIEGLRLVLDGVDHRILGLLVMRTALSRQVVRLRRSHGQGRIDPVREAVIVGRYRGVLGDHGAVIAQQVLRAGRGPDTAGSESCG